MSRETTSSASDEDVALMTDPPGLRLDGRVAWVTGASRGLGRSLAYALAGAGVELLLTARSEGPLDMAAADIRARGGVAHALPGSVSDGAHLTRVADLIDRTWGRLDILINNAGISPVFTPAEHVSDEDWRRIVDVNLFGAFACSKAALPLLERDGGGSVVNVSSVHGTSAHERLAAYAASKGGLEMLTRTLAVEWAPRGIRVNSIAPGYLETDMTAALRQSDRWGAALLARIPMGRFGTTAEIAAATLFLAGGASSYVTGATLFADGGWTAR